MTNLNLKQGDCLKLIKELPDESVDCVLTDVPYYSTNLNFDKAPRIDFDKWFDEMFRVLKTNGVLATFCDFRLGRVISQHKYFRYEIIWIKKQPVGFLDAKVKPLRKHEYILVYTKEGFKKSTYNPQMEKGLPYGVSRGTSTEIYGKMKNANKIFTQNNGERYPTTIQHFYHDNHNSPHPTAKPLQGLDWLVKTYSNPKDLILDPFMGSGTTGIACMNLNRNFIGFELDPEYFQIAKTRINEAKNKADVRLI